MPRSTKQKEVSRKIITLTIADLCHRVCNPEVWKLNLSSFESPEKTPLDFVEFNNDTRRYQYTYNNTAAEDETSNDEQPKRSRDEDETFSFIYDDVIAQSMIVYLLYRMERGWGSQRSFQALSIWGGKAAKKDPNDDDPFPLENLWEEEIKELIASKKLGKTTLNHPDNFWAWPDMYCCREYRWSRRSQTFLGQVHILAEQAAIQMALHLHKHVSEDYAKLAATVLRRALIEGGNDDLQLMPQLAEYIIGIARREFHNYPKKVLDFLAWEMNQEQSNSSKRPRLERDVDEALI